MTLYQVDAFADCLFSGNPAAVIPLDTWIDESLMQNLAMENNPRRDGVLCPWPVISRVSISAGLPGVEQPLRLCHAGQRPRVLFNCFACR